MKIKYIKLYLCSATLLFGISCSDSYPDAPNGDYVAELKEIKIVNAGVKGDSIVMGTVNQDTKLVSFPRLSPNTKNLGALKVEGVFADGSYLEQNVYDYSMTETSPQKEILIKVVNNSKYMYYNMKVRLDVPVFGADFEKPLSVYNYSSSNLDAQGKPVPYSYTGGVTRGTAYDGNYVLIVNRTTPHLLKVSDIEKGDVSNPLFLDMTGISGGTFVVNMGGLANGRTYIANLSGGQTSPLKIYYWETPTSKPQVLANINVASIPDAGIRHGDNFSLNVDEKGNGYIFFGDNASSKLLRLTVTNYTEINNPVVLSNRTGTRGFMSLLRVADTDQYLFSGVGVSVAVASNQASVGYEMNTMSVAKEGMEARIFDFNKERYLLMTSAGYGGASTINPSVYIYNLTKGTTVIEAMQFFEEKDNKNPDLTFALGGSGGSAPAAQSGYSIVKDALGNDSVLYIFGARTESGWALMKYPIKKQDD